MRSARASSSSTARWARSSTSAACSTAPASRSSTSRGPSSSPRSTRTTCAPARRSSRRTRSARNALRLDKYGLSSRVARAQRGRGPRRARGRGGPGVRRRRDRAERLLPRRVRPVARPGRATIAPRCKTAFREQARALARGRRRRARRRDDAPDPELRAAIEASVAAAEGRVPVIASVSLDENGPHGRRHRAPTRSRASCASGARDVIGVNCSDGPMGVLAAVEQDAPARAAGARRRRTPGSRAASTSASSTSRRPSTSASTRAACASSACASSAAAAARRPSTSGASPPPRAWRAARRPSVRGGLGATRRGERIGRDVRRSRRGRRVDADAPSAPGFPARCTRRRSTERSRLAAKIARGRFVVSVEVNPPIGPRPVDARSPRRRMLRGRRRRRHQHRRRRARAGAHEQPRAGRAHPAARSASRRSSTSAVAIGTCSATLAHLLGAHELGIRNLVVITGDPPKMGDFPDATAVYDLDSIGILKLATRLNHGIDPGGKPLGGDDALLARDRRRARRAQLRARDRAPQREEGRRRRARDDAAGVRPGVLDRFLDDVAPLGLPVLVGLLPLASYRNAEFLHNEVPGMQVPDAIRERMRKAGSGAAARKRGRRDRARDARRRCAAASPARTSCRRSSATSSRSR